MRLVITEHDTMFIGYMDFTRATEQLFEYVKETYICYCGLKKPLYVYFADLTVIVSSKATEYTHTLNPILPTKEQMPKKYLRVKFDPSQEDNEGDLSMEVSTNKMSDATLKQLSDALLVYNHDLRKVITPFEVIGV